MSSRILIAFVISLLASDIGLAYGEGARVVLHFKSIGTIRERIIAIDEDVTGALGKPMPDLNIVRAVKAVKILLPKVAKVLDISLERRVGVYWPVANVNFEPSNFVAFVPCDDTDSFVELLSLFELLDGSKGPVFKVNTLTGDVFFVRFENKYIYISQYSELVTGAIPTVSELVSKQEEASDVAIAADCQPLLSDSTESIIESFANWTYPILGPDVLRLGGSQTLNRAELRETIHEGIKCLCRDVNRASLSLQWHESTGSFRAHLLLKPRDGSTLANNFNAFGPGLSRLNKLRLIEADYLRFCVPIPNRLRRLTERAMQEMWELDSGAGDIKEKINLKTGIISIFEVDPKADVVDFCALFLPPKTNNVFGTCLVVGNVNGDRFEQLIREAELGQSKGSEKIRRNAESHLDTPIHRVDSEPIIANKFRSLLPNSIGVTKKVQLASAFCACVGKSLIVGEGKPALECVKAAIQALKGPESGISMAPVEISFSILQMEKRFRYLFKDESTNWPHLLTESDDNERLRDRVTISCSSEGGTVDLGIAIDGEILMALVRDGTKGFRARQM